MFIDKINALFIQKRNERTRIRIVLRIYKLTCCLINCGKLLRCRHSGNITFLVIGMHHILQRCHPYHKKFIEIRGSDADKFKSFQKWNRLVTRLT